MLPDQKPGAAPSISPEASGEQRRLAVRAAVSLEVLVAWSHAPKTPVRYRALDVSAGGMRIRSMLPIRERLIGTVLSTVPLSATPSRPFQVMWCRKVTTDDGSGVAYEAGLRFEA